MNLTPNNFSWSELVRYCKLHKEVGWEERDPSACWNGSKYILSKFGLPDDNFIPINYDKLIDLFHNLSNSNRWIHLTIDSKYEFHYFSLYLGDFDKLIVLQTYGGINKLQKNSFLVSDWINRLADAINGDGNAWRYIFSIPAKYKIPKNIGVVELFYAPIQ